MGKIPRIFYVVPLWKKSCRWSKSPESKVVGFFPQLYASSPPPQLCATFLTIGTTVRNPNYQDKKNKGGIMWCGKRGLWLPQHHMHLLCMIRTPARAKPTVASVPPTHYPNTHPPLRPLKYKPSGHNSCGKFPTTLMSPKLWEISHSFSH